MTLLRAATGVYLLRPLSIAAPSSTVVAAAIPRLKVVGPGSSARCYRRLSGFHRHQEPCHRRPIHTDSYSLQGKEGSFRRGKKAVSGDQLIICCNGCMHA
ncbi:hypothetical protein DAI22_11g126050 [Oryza sativa Japonica Group]|nr:hypothetical protein DAI22_11g126050 [Oryza sativa Japonica Group]